MSAVPFARNVTTLPTPAPFWGPSQPYLCSRDGGSRELKLRRSRCGLQELRRRFPQLSPTYDAAADARALAASDDCGCAYYVAGQYGVCEAVDRAIAECSSRCPGQAACRVVDLSPGTCLGGSPAASGDGDDDEEDDGLDEDACPAGRYAFASEPCGSMHRLQGVGSMANTLKVWVELATRLDANLVHNPLSLCLERNQAGDVFAPLLGLPREPAACTPRRLWRVARKRGWPILNVTLVPEGSHLPFEVPFSVDGAYRQATSLAMDAAARWPEAEAVVFNLVGCPWVRTWDASRGFRAATGSWFRAGLRREGLPPLPPLHVARKPGGPSAISAGTLLPAAHAHDASSGAARPALVAIHYRYGDIAPSIRRLGSGKHGEPTGGRMVSEAERFYVSSMTSIVGVVSGLFAMRSSPFSFDETQLVVFSEGSRDDPPFKELAAKFPQAQIVLESEGGRYTPNPQLLRQLRLMAAADVLITSCGSMGAMLAVLHWRGVTLQHPCTAQLFGNRSEAAQRTLPFAEDGSFDSAGFLRLWEAARADEGAQHSGHEAATAAATAETEASSLAATQALPGDETRAKSAVQQQSAELPRAAASQPAPELRPSAGRDGNAAADASSSSAASVAKSLWARSGW